MAQHKSTVHRESDLQPVYDVLDALRPAHIRMWFNRLDRRVRYWSVIGVATVLLVWSMLSLLQLVTRHIASTTGPFLDEALRAPYQLDERTIPSWTDENLSVLPASFLTYTLDESTTQVIIPPLVPDVAPESEVASQTLPSTVLGKCLYTASQADITNACIGSPAAYLSFGDYQTSEGAVLHLAAAQFTGNFEATEAVKQLRKSASAMGRIGNFVIGVGAVDYFYSYDSTAGQYNFTWSHGAWVFTLASASWDEAESFLGGFPY